MSKAAMEATLDTRKPSFALGLVALLLALAGAIPTYGIVGAVLGVVLGFVAWRQSKGTGSTLAVLAIYLGILRIVLTLVVVFLFPGLLTSSEPRHVTMPSHVAAPAKPGNSAPPKP